MASIPFLSRYKNTVLIFFNQRVHLAPWSTPPARDANYRTAFPLLTAPQLVPFAQKPSLFFHCTQYSLLAHSVSLLHTLHFPGCSLSSHVTLPYFHHLWQVVLSPCPGSVTFNPLTCSHLTKQLHSDFYKVIELAWVLSYIYMYMYIVKLSPHIFCK